MYEEQFKAMGEPTRMLIIKLLSCKDLCVCDIEEIMQISQPRISQHLKILNHSGLVTMRKDGQRRVCSLNIALLNRTLDEFTNYVSKPLADIPELSTEYERLQNLDGNACSRKLARLIK